jgi:glutamyl-tRNA reductase
MRERFAFAEAAIPPALARLRASGWVQEAVILSTCNRVEIYAATGRGEAETLVEVQQFLLDCHQYREPLNGEVYALGEREGVEHLFKVACGLDSMVLGETEILGQLKKAYELAFQHRHTGSQLNKAFQKAFNVAKQIRTETNIQRGSISVASVAAELAERIFSDLAHRGVLILGAGDTSEKAARALRSRGAGQMLVSNRSPERAAALAAELGGRAVAFAEWDREFEAIDVVISSTAAPHFILDGRKLEPLMPRRANRPLLLIDLAVPRDIDPAVNLLENVYLYNIDDLQGIAEDYLKQRQEEISRCEAIIREKAKGLREALAFGRRSQAPQAGKWS